MCETLREPVKVLKSLSEKTTNKEYKFKRLYRNLYNPEFYFLAYKNISQSQGSMTPGVDGKSLDGMSEKRINALIESLKDFSYQPNPARRVYIEKKNSTKKRPLGIPSTEDKLVQEVVKMILESIYEPNFSDYSHGFRPNRSCHSALQQIQNQFTGITWFVEGDIHACFDSFDHHVLVNILRERIEDENFLALIWKMLKAGYMEQWVYNCTFSGTPQGSGVSPMLANIYLSKLDEFAERLKKEFSKGKSKDNLEYSRAASKLYYIRRRNRANWDSWNEQQRKEALRLQKDAISYKHSLPSKRANNEDYKSLVYCRYADDFLIGVIGSFEDASEIKDRGNMVHMTDVEIVSQVNAEIRGIYNYYSIAENATVIKNFAFILEYSMYKTFGLKYQKSVYKIQRKYRRNGIFMVPYNTKKGLKYCEFYHDGFKKKRYACSFEPDLLPQYVKYDNPNYLRTRIKLGVCELCGENTGDICMHHVKSLKSIKADNEWNTIMLTKRRKTLAVCPNCYAMITK